MISFRRALIAPAALAALFLAGCGDNRELDYKQVEVDELNRQVKELEAKLAEKDGKAVAVSLTESKKAGHTDVKAAQEAIGSTATVSGDHPTEIWISIENEILFKSGSAALSTGAKSTLNKVAAVVEQQYPGYDIRVVGHTDDQKITRSHNEWDDNWDLSAGRARAVLKYLIERGVPAGRSGIAGFADQKPLVPNSGDANRAKNRRVEIHVVPPVPGEIPPPKPVDEGKSKPKPHKPSR